MKSRSLFMSGAETTAGLGTTSLQSPGQGEGDCMLIGEVLMGASPLTGLSRATRRDTRAVNCEQPRITVVEFVMNRRGWTVRK
jgi:hypothetical protein